MKLSDTLPIPDTSSDVSSSEPYESFEPVRSTSWGRRMAYNFLDSCALKSWLLSLVVAPGTMYVAHQLYRNKRLTLNTGKVAFIGTGVFSFIFCSVNRAEQRNQAIIDRITAEKEALEREHQEDMDKKIKLLQEIVEAQKRKQEQEQKSK